MAGCIGALGDQFGTERLVRIAKIWLSKGSSKCCSGRWDLGVGMSQYHVSAFIKQHFKTLIPAVASDVYGVAIVM